MSSPRCPLRLFIDLWYRSKPLLDVMIPTTMLHLLLKTIRGFMKIYQSRIESAITFLKCRIMHDHVYSNEGLRNEYLHQVEIVEATLDSQMVLTQVPYESSLSIRELSEGHCKIQDVAPVRHEQSVSGTFAC